MHLFSEGQIRVTICILDSIITAKEAAEELLVQLKQGNWSEYEEITETMICLLGGIKKTAQPYRDKYDFIWLPLTCESMITLLNDLQCKKNQKNYIVKKIQFELIPVLEEAYQQFYFWTYVYSYPDREKKYYEEEIYELSSNHYTNESIKTGKYKYDVSFVIMAYNKLEYTKLCIENLMKNIPENLNYELILWDNGSTDGTKEYFESLNSDKLLESRINWAIGNTVLRISEAKYFILISNDIIVTKNVIFNMLECAKSNDKIARIVPSTPNISNLQSIYANYESFDQLQEFAEKNNVLDPSRWEERVRLCDPISLNSMPLYCSKNGICMHGYYLNDFLSFPDDKISLLYRRRGYKQILQKDAYCHHFGSVTIKEDKNIQKENYYLDGRMKFRSQFGIDPWSKGFCFDSLFNNKCVVKAGNSHIEILGINCGFGGNSLKIKEQLKEYFHIFDTKLINITDEKEFIFDLDGISDQAEFINDKNQLVKFLQEKNFDYIIWEIPFLCNYKFDELFDLLYSHMNKSGVILIKNIDSFLDILKRDSKIENLEILKNWVRIEL